MLKCPDDALSHDLPQPQTETETKKDNFFVAHFKGDASLGVSFWLNHTIIAGFFAPIILVFWIVYAHKALGLVAVLSAVLLLIANYMWAWVGLWRSADKHQSRGGKKFWAKATKVVLILNIVGTVVQLSLAI